MDNIARNANGTFENSPLQETGYYVDIEHPIFPGLYPIKGSLNGQPYAETDSANLFSFTHGGSRPGAGRKQVDDPRIARSIKFSDEEWNLLKLLVEASPQSSASEMVRHLVRQELVRVAKFDSKVAEAIKDKKP